MYQFYCYGMKNLGRFNVKISYDPAMIVAEAVVKGTLKDGNYLSADFSTANEGYITIYGSDNAVIREDGRGIAFAVIFRIRPNASGTAEITMSGTNGILPELYNYEGKPFEVVDVKNGSIIIK